MVNPRSTPRYLVKVELQVLTTEQHALIVVDEADLKRQIAQREAQLKAMPYLAKPQKDKKGAVMMQILGEDWNI